MQLMLAFCHSLNQKNKQKQTKTKMRILSTLILIATLILMTGCDRDFICLDMYGNPTDCTEQNPITLNTSTESETQARQVNCQNAGFGYPIGQPTSSIRTIQIDSVYCDTSGVARVAASFFAGQLNTSWYDVEWMYLDTLVQSQSVDYVLPVDSLGNSVYYTLGLYADPNTTHPQGNPVVIEALRSFE